MIYLLTRSLTPVRLIRFSLDHFPGHRKQNKARREPHIYRIIICGRILRSRQGAAYTIANSQQVSAILLKNRIRDDFRRPEIQKFPRRACPQTPLVHAPNRTHQISWLRSCILACAYNNARVLHRYSSENRCSYRVYIDTPWSTQLVKVITTLLVAVSACFPAQSPTSDSKLCCVVDPNHSLWLSTSHLTTLRLHMILTKTSTNTDKSSSSQERPISKFNI